MDSEQSQSLLNRGTQYRPAQIHIGNWCINSFTFPTGQQIVMMMMMMGSVLGSLLGFPRLGWDDINSHSFDYSSVLISSTPTSTKNKANGIAVGGGNKNIKTKRRKFINRRWFFLLSAFFFLGRSLWTEMNKLFLKIKYLKWQSWHKKANYASEQALRWREKEKFEKSKMENLAAGGSGGR